jgi:hypothetical protein
MQYVRDVVAQAFFLSHATAARASDFDLEAFDLTLFRKYEQPGLLAQVLLQNQIPSSPEAKSAVILLAEMIGIQSPRLPAVSLLVTAARYAKAMFFPAPAPT